ncbi:hypothetical protein S40285_10800 [Stachybotrys chlorohalonatus IBT 40285]|uniref:Uncharacterized protein n=1 Tax=Stachybotrys chlorohalonatus (strain IBT 40285) TaxID=1283841 RepID=A0A084QSB5_STAC4|nr:hypothetical protein S40285_10800 [Stachybotrys chlorohalonata IBT 40285]
MEHKYNWTTFVVPILNATVAFLAYRSYVSPFYWGRNVETIATTIATNITALSNAVTAATAALPGPLDMDPITRAVATITTAINAAATRPPPSPSPLDLDFITRAATAIADAIAAAARPAPPPSLGQDLANLRDEIRSLQEEVRVLRGQIQAGQCHCAPAAAVPAIPAATVPAIPAAAPPPSHRPGYMAPTVALLEARPFVANSLATVSEQATLLSMRAPIYEHYPSFGSSGPEYGTAAGLKAFWIWVLRHLRDAVAHGPRLHASISSPERDKMSGEITVAKITKLAGQTSQGNQTRPDRSSQSAWRDP